MGSPYASGKKAISVCDRCGHQFLLKKLKYQVVKQKRTGTLVCPECYDIDHPQLMLGTFPVQDPQALRNPRRDNSYVVSGNLQEGSRVIQWGWNPVGGSQYFDAVLTPNYLVSTTDVGIVKVVVS